MSDTQDNSRLQEALYSVDHGRCPGSTLVKKTAPAVPKTAPVPRVHDDDAHRPPA